MRQKNNKVTYWLGIIVIGIFLGFSLQFVRAWTEPTSTPPNGNIGAPINTGNIGQYKEGNLVISTNPLLPGGGLKANGLTVQYGNVGIGTLNPGALLEMKGLRPYIVLDSTNGSAADSEIYIRRNGANKWAFGTQVGDGTENFQLYNYNTATVNFSVNQSTGNVGIGTTSPGSKLEVGSGEVRFPGGSSVGGTTHFNYSGDGKNYIRGTTIIADSGGNVGIGTASPGVKLDVNGGVRGSELYTNDNIYLAYLGDWISNRLNQGVTTNAQPQFARMYDDDRGYYIDANTTSRMDSIRLNYTLDASVLHLASDSTIYLLTRNGGQVRVGTEWGGSGDMIVYDNIGANGRDPYYSFDTPGNARATNYYNNSDIRLKKDISSLNGEETLQKVLQLQGVTYRLKKETEKNMDPNKLHLGFVAQEVEPIFPEIVVTDKSPEKLKSVSYESLVPALVEAIKEQQKQLEEQQKQLDELRQELKK